MKKILLFIILIFWVIFLLNSSYSDENNCKYTEKINKCLEEKNKRTIEDFVCIEWTREEVVYQIVLDEKFNELDEEINNYLLDLETKKNKYFWPEASSNYISASDEIEKKFWVYWDYWKKYNEICNISIISDAMDCQDWKSSNIVSSWFFTNTKCIAFAETKLHIYSQVAYDILMLNKLDIMKDSSKLHLQSQRKKYDEVLDSMMINAWYMERIWKKWPSKLKNTH